MWEWQFLGRVKMQSILRSLLAGLNIQILKRDLSLMRRIKIVKKKSMHVDRTENIVKQLPTLIEKKIDLFSSKVNQDLNGI